MHDDQIDIDLDTVELLLADQFPHLSVGKVSRLPVSGTVNAYSGSAMTMRPGSSPRW